jgi:hypothetical protein
VISTTSFKASLGAMRPEILNGSRRKKGMVLFTM